MTLRSKIAMLLAEFLGTAALATVAINITRSQIGIGYFVAIGLSAALAALVLVFAAASGAHFNPAVTLGLWTLRKVPTLQAIAYIAAQILGGVAAWKLGQYLSGAELRNIAGDSFKLRILIAEAAGTMVFGMGYAAAAYHKHTGARYAATVGGALFVGILVASLASNAMLNPAVALGNQSWGRAYIFGPIIGAVLGMNLYAILFAPARALIDDQATRHKVGPAAAKRETSMHRIKADDDEEENDDDSDSDADNEVVPTRGAVNRSSTVTAVRTSSASKSVSKTAKQGKPAGTRSKAAKKRKVNR